MSAGLLISLFIMRAPLTGTWCDVQQNLFRPAQTLSHFTSHHAFAAVA
ncbi:protein of unknown function [Paraburkholderia dioscoreae]|uniref:Uncharacterized protein n=1 Tax=Paraburkholderia dioscoreae TaxID=2604047 RepID=A0A5Q4ZMZ8_9BURK|nr:protein of unknown function [Paraburkholderia dioscoreae]